MVLMRRDLHDRVMTQITDERYRQDFLKQVKGWSGTCSDAGRPDGIRLAVLGEEFGEVCLALNDKEPRLALYAELVQVAAVAAAWAEGILLEQEEGTVIQHLGVAS